MRSFELLSHTADVRILAKGSTTEELFIAGLEGLSEVILPEYERTASGGAVNYEKKIESYDLSALLIDFLSEALCLMHENNVLINQAEIMFLSENSLYCTLAGYHIEEFSTDAKAVTYHEAEIVEKNGILESLIVLDI